ncbi:unnamed protein product [Malus baccata var. baccata]
MEFRRWELRCFKDIRGSTIFMHFNTGLPLLPSIASSVIRATSLSRKGTKSFKAFAYNKATPLGKQASHLNPINFVVKLCTC